MSETITGLGNYLSHIGSHSGSSPGGGSPRTSGEVLLKLGELSNKEHEKGKQEMPPTILVKCNLAMGRNYNMQGYNITFDRYGIASIPAQLRPLVEREQLFRPGRFEIIEKQPAVEEPAPVPAPIVPQIAEVDTDPVADLEGALASLEETASQEFPAEDEQEVPDPEPEVAVTSKPSTKKKAAKKAK